jgi:hypothetical protein
MSDGASLSSALVVHARRILGPPAEFIAKPGRRDVRTFDLDFSVD